jgi:exodeoxyribonuclease V gamma subunit
MGALRGDLDRVCGGVPRDEPFIDILAPEVRSKLAPALSIIEPPISGALREGREVHLPLAALRRFLECPLQGAAQYALGMADDEGGDEEDAENEPLTQTNLDRTVLLRDAFWTGRGETEAARRHFEQALLTRQLQGLAPVGPFADAASKAFDKRLALCVQQAKAMGVNGLAGWERIRIGGGAEEIADADRVLKSIVLDVPMRRPSGETTLRVALRAAVTVSANRDRMINCIARNSGAKASDFLSGYLTAIALAAAGETQAQTFEVLVIGGADDGTKVSRIARRLRMFPRDEAIAYLSNLAEDIFSGRNHYFLPFEAVEKIVEKTTGKKWPSANEVTDIIETLRQNEFAHCRSDYGPVRNPRDYPPPPPDAAIAIIKRRFEPIIGIFEGVE